MTREKIDNPYLSCAIAYDKLSEKKNRPIASTGFGAQSRNRTNHTRIFSPLLYRLSYLGMFRLLENRGLMATQKGLEPSTSSVTGWHSNQLNYCAIMVGTTGLEPVTLCL